MIGDPGDVGASMARIERLTLDLLDDAITDPEVAELEGLLDRVGDGANDHFLLLDIEAALRGLGRCPDLRSATMERIRAETTARMQRAVLGEIAGRSAPGWLGRPAADGRSGRARFAKALVALAAIALLAVGLGVALRRPGAARPAVVVAGADANANAGGEDRARVVDLQGRLEVLIPGGRSAPARVGQEVAPGQTLRTGDEESYAVVEFADRTRFDLSPDSTLRLMGAEAGKEGAGRRVLLASGVLRADVTSRPVGPSLVIVTPVAEVRVPGAAALLSTTTPDCTWIDLAAGRAEMVRQSDGERVEVVAGSSATARAGRGGLVVKPGGPPSFRPARRLNFAPAHTLAFSADGTALLAANSRRLFRYSLDDGAEQVVPIPTPFRDGARANLSQDGSTLALCLPDELSVWDVAGMRRRLAVATAGAPNRPIAVAPGGAWLAAQDGDPARPSGVLLWDVDSGRLRGDWELVGPIRNLASAPDGGTLIIGTREAPRTPTHRILLWDTVADLLRTTLITDLPASWQVVLAPDGRRLATVGRDGSIQVWHVPNRSIERVIDAHGRPVRSLAFSPDGRRLAGGTVYGSVLLWDVATGEEQAELKAEQRGVRLLAFSPDGKTLASGTLDDPILLWDVPDPPRSDPAPEPGPGYAQ